MAVFYTDPPTLQVEIPRGLFSFTRWLAVITDTPFIARHFSELQLSYRELHKDLLVDEMWQVVVHRVVVNAGRAARNRQQGILCLFNV